MIATVVLVLILALLAGVPVAFALLGSALIYFLLSPEASPLVLLQRVQAMLQSFPLLAVPFFVLAGNAMARGGIAERIVALVDTLVGHWRGGLAQIAVGNSLIIGGMSGSAIADAAVDARTMVPAMQRHGYELGFAAVVSGASSVIAPILPPSIALVLFGLIGNVSIGRLFVGGVVPALLVAAALMLTVRIVAVRRGYASARLKPATWTQRWAATRRCAYALAMPVLLLLGLRLGFLTMTELAAAAAAYAIGVGLFVHRDLLIRDLPGLFMESARVTAAVLIIVAASAGYAHIFAVEQVPQALLAAAREFTDSRFVILLMINVILLALGALVDGAGILVVATPMLLLLGREFGIDPVHMGVMVVINLTIGTITPPVGAVMFTVCAITGCSTREFVRHLAPFLLALVLVLCVVAALPATVLALADSVYGARP